MACVEMLSDDEDEIIRAPVAEAPAAPAEPVSAPQEEAPPALRSVVVASMELSDSSEEEMLAPAPKPPAAPLPVAVEGGALPPKLPLDDEEEEGSLAALAPKAPAPKAPAPKAPAAKAPAAKAPPPAPKPAVKAAAQSTAKDEVKLAEKRPAPEDAAAGIAVKQPRLAAAAGAKKPAPKAEAKEKKLTKDEMETKVLEYMRQQNRPYNAQNVFDNLHGAVPKGSVQTIMDALCAAGKLVLKEYGKIKVYLAAQTAPTADGDEELAAAVQQAAAQKKDIQGQVDDVRKSLSQLESKHAAAREAKAATEEVAKLESKAAALRAASGEEAVDEREVVAVEEALKKAAGTWRKRKRLCVDALKTLGEGIGAKLQQLCERYGVDTDEDCGHVMPKEFS